MYAVVVAVAVVAALGWPSEFILKATLLTRAALESLFQFFRFCVPSLRNKMQLMKPASKG